MIVAPLPSDLEAPLFLRPAEFATSTLQRLSNAGSCDPEARMEDLSVRTVMSEPQSNFLGLRGFYNQSNPPRSVANAKDSLFCPVFIRSADAGAASRIVRAGQRRRRGAHRSAGV